jgi:hypothetical protein
MTVMIIDENAIVASPAGVKSIFTTVIIVLANAQIDASNAKMIEIVFIKLP